MEQCPIKEMEIEFQCVIDTENSLFEPVPAKKVKPEWYKKLPALIKDVDGNTLKAAQNYTIVNIQSDRTGFSALMLEEI